MVRSPAAHAAHRARSPIWISNGAPQARHSGSVMKHTLGQHSAHRVPSPSISAPQATQRGGSTASSATRPSRRATLRVRDAATVAGTGGRAIAVLIPKSTHAI